jgi:hypothetical protein
VKKIEKSYSLQFARGIYKLLEQAKQIAFHLRLGFG